MLYLVFPKVFEWKLFLLSAGPRIIFLYPLHELTETWVIGLHHTDMPVYFLTCVVGDSDIGFNREYADMIMHAKEYFSNEIFSQFKFVLCGTCGGSNTNAQQEIGDTYLIRKAIKFDRGEINSDFNFRIDVTKSVVSQDNTNYTYYSTLSKAVTLSSNYLFHADIRTIDNNVKDEIMDKFSIDIAQENIVCEMETYDFFAVCHQKNLSQYSCLRVISDIYGRNLFHVLNAQLDKLKIEKIQKNQSYDVSKIQRLVRKSLDMRQLVESVYKLAATNLQLYGYRMFDESLDLHRERLGLSRIQNMNDLDSDEASSQDYLSIFDCKALNPDYDDKYRQHLIFTVNKNILLLNNYGNDVKCADGYAIGILKLMEDEIKNSIIQLRTSLVSPRFLIKRKLRG